MKKIFFATMALLALVAFTNTATASNDDNGTKCGSGKCGTSTPMKCGAGKCGGGK